MAEDPEAAWKTDYCLRPYNPWKFNGERNPYFSSKDGRLLDFKEGKDWAVTAETAEFKTWLDTVRLPPGGAYLVVVPGHGAKETNEGRPLARVAHALAEADGRCEALVDTLIRTQEIPKLARGGDRSLDQHLKSMIVNNRSSIRRATVIILDDTVTTGHSLAASRQLLDEAGAMLVAAVGLARTVKYY